MVSEAPVTKLASGPARYAARMATSWTVPRRPTDISGRVIARTSGLALISVSVGPGAIALTVIPRGPRSRARPLVMDATAPLVMAYTDAPGKPARSDTTLPV